MRAHNSSMLDDTPIRFVRRTVFKATQEELAAIGGVSRSRVSRYESGREPPSFAFLERIRGEANRRGLPFSSEWFFETPKPHQDAAA